MTDLLMFGGFLAAGYVLAIYTWPALRTVIAGAEQEIAWLKARAAELEARLRDAFGGRG
jgi:hypothetical protein